MYTIKLMPEFHAWLNQQKDLTTRLRLSRRLDKAARGLLGDVKLVGKNAWEMREDFGPGWRMYYTLRGDQLIVMLIGGNKSTQRQDIKEALLMSAIIED